MRPAPQRLPEASACAGKAGRFVPHAQTRFMMQGELRPEDARRGCVWPAGRDVLAVSTARGYLTLRDSKHQTNRRDWKLCALMVSAAFGYMPGALALAFSANLRTIGEIVKERELGSSREGAAY